jgi:hypothetical protein
MFLHMASADYTFPHVRYPDSHVQSCNSSLDQDSGHMFTTCLHLLNPNVATSLNTKPDR